MQIRRLSRDCFIDIGNFQAPRIQVWAEVESGFASGRDFPVPLVQLGGGMNVTNPL
jgi:hypothetical protein